MQSELVEIGSRKLKVNEDEVEIATAEEWRLVECTKYSTPPWRSLKLYLDRPAAKNVWRLSINKNYRGKTKDGFLLEKFFPKIWPWVMAQANGKDVPFPEGAGEEAAVVIPMKIFNFVVDALRSRDPDYRPLSHMPQTRSQGRYLVEMVAEEFGIDLLEAKIYISAMIEQGAIEFVMFNKHKRISGLRLVEGFDG
jgi:hypothetical protein